MYMTHKYTVVVIISIVCNLTSACAKCTGKLKSDIDNGAGGQFSIRSFGA